MFYSKNGIQSIRNITLFCVLFIIVAFVLRIGSSRAIEGETVYTGTVAEFYSCEDEDCGLRGDDAYSDPVPIGFDFDFYGNTFTDVYININGVLHFGCPSEEYDNDESLPTDFDGECDLEGEVGTTQPLAILPFWDDIITTPKDLYCTEDPLVDECDDWSWEGNYASILYRTVGEEGSRKFIVQWTNMHLYSDPNVPLGTFQVILYEGSNEFQIQYRNLLGDPARSQGSSATIGIQYDNFNYTIYSHEASTPISPETAIRFVLGEGYGYDDEAAYDLVYLSNTLAPEAPNLTFPADEATDVVRNPNMQWSSVAGAETYTLTVSRNEGFSDLVFQELDLTSTNFTITDLLDENTTYYWNVRAVNESGDAYSNTYSFTTSAVVGTPDDNDGATEETEDAAPNSGDANDDGTADSEQTTVTSVVSPVNSKYVVLEADTCTANTSVSINPETTVTTQDDDNYSYPLGLLNFTLTGCTVGGSETVTQYFYGTYPSNVVLRKYNSTTHIYTTITDAVITPMTIGGESVLRVTYTVTDGGALDEDGVANGTIVDPAGIAVLGTTTTSTTPTTTSTGAPNTGLKSQSIYPAVLLIVSGLLIQTRYGKKEER
jgi:hypothetical protein